MKKLLALSAVALLSTSAFAASPNHIVNIAGKVVAQTCKFDTLMGGTVLPDAKVEGNNLVAVTGTDLTKEFSVKLVECDTKSPVYVAFDGAHANVHDNGNLINKAPASVGAQNVQVKLIKHGQDIDLKNQTFSNQDVVTPTTGTAEFKFKATYVVNGGTPTTGAVNTSIPVLIKYQ